MPWTPEEVKTALRPPTPIKLGVATSIGAMPNTGILDKTRNWIQGNVPESILNANNNLLNLGKILGLNDPASAYAGGVVPATIGAIRPKIKAIVPQLKSKMQPFAFGLEKLRSAIKAKPTLSEKIFTKYATINPEDMRHGFITNSGSIHEIKGEHFDKVSKLLDTDLPYHTPEYTGVATYNVTASRQGKGSSRDQLFIQFMGPPTSAQIKSVREYLKLNDANQIQWEILEHTSKPGKFKEFSGTSLSELVHRTNANIK